MKRLTFSGAVLGLTLLLSACSGSMPIPAEYSLTLNLAGVTRAPVTVTNTTSHTTVFTGALEGSKTLSGLSAGSVLKVEAGAVNGYTAPQAQQVQLNSDKTLALTYTAVAQVTYALTLTVQGAPALVTVTDQGNGRVLFNGTVSGTQTINGLPENATLKVEGAPVDGFVAPAAQTIELTGNKNVSLEYIAPKIQASNARLTAGATTIVAASLSFPIPLTATATVTGLPAWITAESQEVTLTASASTLNLSLRADSTVPSLVQTLPAQLVLTDKGHLIGRQRIYLTVLPTPISAPSLWINSDVTTQDGAFWYTDRDGSGSSVHRVTPDGTAQAYTLQGSAVSSPHPVAGEDGFMHLVFQGKDVRLDPLTGEQVTSSLLNPNTVSSFVDAKGRGWENYFGIYRNDYQPCTTDPCWLSAVNMPVLVPGSTEYSHEVADVQGTTVWVSNFIPGSPSTWRLIRMNGDTLEQTTVLEMNKLVDPHLFARPSGVWLSHYGIGVPGGGPIARVDQMTGAVQTFDVVVDGVSVSAYETVGVTDDGRHLLLIPHPPVASDNRDEYVLYNPMTQTVEKRLVIGGPSWSRAFITLVDRSGHLWLRGIGAGDLPDNALYVY